MLLLDFGSQRREFREEYSEFSKNISRYFRQNCLFFGSFSKVLTGMLRNSPAAKRDSSSLSRRQRISRFSSENMRESLNFKEELLVSLLKGGKKASFLRKIIRDSEKLRAFLIIFKVFRLVFCVFFKGLRIFLHNF